MANKKAQGLSLTTIIVAAIALIVLVVLVAIFAGKMGYFTKGVDQVDAELTALKITYGDCHPASAKEATFRDAMNKATSEADKDNAISNLKSDITSCKTYIDQSSCEGANCAWK